MDLYIANTTKQHQRLPCSIPEMKGIKIAEIPIGQQVKVFGNLNQLQIDAIVEQHSKYGMVKYDEVDHTKPFIGLVWSADRKIPLDSLLEAFDHNNEVLTERGAELRKQAAVSINNQVEAAMSEVAGGEAVSLKNSGVSFMEEERNGSDNHALLAETIEVRRDAAQGEQARPRGGRRKAK